ncbi:MAG TPA: hypothetical protein DCW90_18960 [Lachnospiraceae bacterium]|jgi:hypothetical protein|nr:hypothetical protein [Lachnospiraceae bacterium]
MIEYITAINRRVLTKIIEENKRERFQIVTDMLNCIESGCIGVYEYGRYMLSVEHDKIQLVTPDKVYVKMLLVH